MTWHVLHAKLPSQAPTCPTFLQAGNTFKVDVILVCEGEEVLSSGSGNDSFFAFLGDELDGDWL